jgi:hypothetical protein
VLGSRCHRLAVCGIDARNQALIEVSLPLQSMQIIA